MAVIDLLKLYTKKEMDDLYADVIKGTLSYFTQSELQDGILTLAIQFCKLL